MFSRNRLSALVALLGSALPIIASGAAGHVCVWKVTAPNGGTLYLGGSIHALRSVDYPLPAAYNRAFEASDRLVFEVDEKAMRGASKEFEKVARYPKGDSLKNHVDPRTYDYLRRFFGILKVPEEKFAFFRPWALAMMLQAPQLHGLSYDLGVEGFLERRAHANSKPVSGLESAKESMEVFSGLNERQSEAVLLLTFIPQQEDSAAGASLTEAWRRGDAEKLQRLMRASLADFPAFADRILDARNRNWIPKIERALHSGHTCFVVVGSAHMGGPNGLLALLRGRGYQIEQL